MSGDIPACVRHPGHRDHTQDKATERDGFGGFGAMSLPDQIEGRLKPTDIISDSKETVSL